MTVLEGLRAMNVTLSPESRAFVDRQTKRGFSPDEIITKALEEQMEYEAMIDKINNRVQKGRKEIEQGKTISADEVLRKLDDIIYS